MGLCGIMLVLEPTFHVGLHLDGGVLLLGSRLLAKHTNALIVLSLLPHRRTSWPHSGTPQRFGHRTTDWGVSVMEWTPGRGAPT